jgi:hypothetical protein
MTKVWGRAALLGLLAVAWLGIPGTSEAQEFPLGTYEARMVNTDRIFPRNTVQRIVVRLNQLTPVEDARRMGDLLREDGQTGLKDVLWNREVGSFQIDQRLAQPIAAAFDIVDGEYHRLILIVPRDIGVRELWGRTSSASYPFTVIELDVDANGNGSGEILPATRIRLRPDRHVEFDEFGVLPLRVLNVRRIKG